MKTGHIFGNICIYMYIYVLNGNENGSHEFERDWGRACEKFYKEGREVSNTQKTKVLWVEKD